MAILKIESKRAINRFNNKKIQVRQGEVYLATLIGLIKGVLAAPVLIVQNNTGNKFSPCTIVIVGTKYDNDYKWDFDKITTIDKRRIKSFEGIIERCKFEEIHSNLMDSLIR